MSALFAILFVTSLAASPAPDAAAPVAGLGRGGGYLHVSPGTLSMTVGAPGVAHTWSLGAGRHWASGDGFALQFGGLLEHVAIGGPERRHLLRVGPELRLGGSNARIFAYVLARTGFESMFSRSQETDGPVVDGVQLIFGAGAGVQAALGPRRRLLLGFEPALDVVLPALRPMARARLFLGVRF